MRSFIAVMMLMIAAIAQAQVTTSSMSGKVTGTNDETIIGATVKAVHEPSGTTYNAVTNVDGRFAIQGMRVGGPYTVEISYVGYKKVVLGPIYLRLGQTYNMPVNMKESAEELNEVVVTGKAGLDGSKTGAAMSMYRDQIEAMPSVNHGIADVIRLNPQVNVSNSGAMYFAGTNNRYNSFQIDGAMNNDVFGLTANGSNGGQAGTQPVSMETIAQINVNVAPYDIRQSGFTGGAINAITKSGTNEFHGSVYGFGNNEHLMGKYKMMNGETSGKMPNQDDYQAGITLGGPIIKDKLFFFGSYERANNTYTNSAALGSEASRVDATVAQKMLDALKEMAQKQGLNYNGTINASDVYTKSDKASAKFDWNINDNNKFSIRYSFVGARQLNSASNAASLNSSDYSYDFVSKTHSVVAELQSKLSNSVSNELRASYVGVRDKRDPGDPFPMISINNVGDGTLNLGNERSSMANALNQDIFTITDNVSWLLGDHNLVFGTHNEFYKFSNLFIQDLYGTYYFQTPEDFLAGKINRYRLGHADETVTGDPNWAAAFGAGQIGLYAQDKWSITDNFDLTYGLRMDMPLFFDTPAENKGFNDYSASKGWNFKTNSKLSSTPLVSPRVGFRWDINKNDEYVLRGGVGIFTGRIPFVWLSNNFSNTGIQLKTYSTYSTDKLSVILDPHKQSQNEQFLTAGGGQTVNVFDKNFKFAQNLRANLAIDFDFLGIDWTAEAIYSKTLNDILYKNLAIEATGKTVADRQPELSFDKRPTFQQAADAKQYTGIYALENTNKGYTYNLSLMARKSFDFGLDLMASYTFTKSKSVNSGTSSVAQSNWMYNYTIGNPNDPELGYSAFNVPHMVRVSAFYTHKWKANRQTTIGLIYNGQSGIPYSVYYYNDFNGDGSYGNDLMFIPTDAQVDQMKFKATSKYTEAQQKANMKQWLANEDYLKDHRGEYFQRYAANEKFEHHFDLHLAHKIGFMVGKNMRAIEFSLDVINIGNLLNKEWGRSYSSSGYYSPVTYDKSGAFQFLHDGDYNMHNYSDLYSRWRAQAGIRFTF